MIPIVAMLPPLLPVDLAWNAPAECPTRDAVVDEVAHVLAQSSGPRPHAAARADVTRDERGQWHAALSVDVDGARTANGGSTPRAAGPLRLRPP